jgi:hypothetical protein
MDMITELIYNLLAPTAWEMDIPKAYGLFHICVMVIGFSLCFFTAWKLRKLDDRKHRFLLLSIGIFLAVCEVYKQLMYEVVLEPGDGYRWGNFSFQLCSIPMYLCLILPFLKNGPVKRALSGLLMSYNLLGGFIAFFEPSGLFHEHWTLTGHALLWHMLLVFLGAYVGLSGRGCRNGKEFRNTTFAFLALCITAFCINCAFWKISDHQIKMFFLGPGNSPIIVFKQISEMFGWVVCNLIYIPCVCLGAYLIYRLCILIISRISQKDTVLTN